MQVFEMFVLLPQDKRQAEFDDLVDRYERKIFNLIYRLIGDYDDAADLTQDTFVAAYRSFDGFRAEATPYTWLYRIAINVCKNRFRQLGRRKDMEPVSLDEGRLSDNQMNKVGFSVSSASPERLLEREEMRQMVESAISSLPEDYKIVIVLRDLHGFSYREVAEAAELSVDVVKTRLARAREAIRRKLSHYL